MKIEEYQALAMRTSPDGHDRVLNGCMGLIGESGEVADVVKKWKFQSGDHAQLPREKLIDECGDVLWYCAELATGLNDKLADLMKQCGEDFYNDMHEPNKETPIEILAGRLSVVASMPFTELFDPSLDEEDVPYLSTKQMPPELRESVTAAWQKANAKANIVGIVITVTDFLELYCRSTLEEAMEHNIEKLRRRYPDGFDPERSLHRTE